MQIQDENIVNLVEQVEHYLYKEKNSEKGEEAIKKILAVDPKNGRAIKGLKFIRDNWIQDIQRMKLEREQRRQTMEVSTKGEEEQRYEDIKEKELRGKELEAERYLKIENNLARAEEAIKEVLDRDPNRSFSWRLRSITHRIKSQSVQDNSEQDRHLRLAQQSIDKSLELDPANPWHYEELTLVHLARKDKVKAKQAIDRAIELRPGEPIFQDLINEIEKLEKDFEFSEIKKVEKKLKTSLVQDETRDISDSKKRDIHFAWDIHYKCNFRCPYCWFYKGWAEAARLNIYLSPEQWMEHWQRIYDKYGSVRIEITGGEPFLYPNFIRLVKLLSTIHIVKVTTNLTGDIETWIKEIDPQHVVMDLNFHPLFSEIDGFIRKTILLKNADFNPGVCYLAYPPQMGSMWYYKKKFDEVDISFALAAFWGKYEDRDYPVAYTEEEKELIRPFLGDIDRITYHLNGESPEGKLCNAGHKYANIQANGKVVRCAQYADKPFGNITNPEFSLFTEPLPCEVDLCPGNEYDNIC